MGRPPRGTLLRRCHLFLLCMGEREKLGYNQGSKTPAEWDITDKLQPGENTVALEVYRWSSGSYLECQDMWRLSGIERNVYLYSTPQQYIADYKVVSTLDKDTYRDGIFNLDVRIAGKSDPNAHIAYQLKDANGKIVLKEEIKVPAGNNNRITFKGVTIPGVKAWVQSIEPVHASSLAERQ